MSWDGELEERGLDGEAPDPFGGHPGQLDTGDLLIKMRMRELQDMRARFWDAMRMAEKAQALGSMDRFEATELAHNALCDYLTDLRPYFEKAYSKDSPFNLRRDYWNSVELGEISTPSIGETITVARPNVADTQEKITHVEAPTAKFVGLKSLIGTPAAITAKCYYKQRVVGRAPTEAYQSVRVYIPLTVIRNAAGAIASFRSDIGLDLDVTRGTPTTRL